MRQDQFAAPGRLFALGRQIDEFDGRKRPIPNAPRQYQAMDFTPVGGMARLEARGSRAEHQGARVGFAQARGNGGSVIPKTFVVLVGRVVFFVDDQEAQVFEGREKSASGPHRDGRVAPP